jgi:hypothetical protein
MPTKKTGTPGTTAADGKKSRSNEPFIEIAQDEHGWHWQLYGGNGQPVARNAVAYGEKKAAIAAAKGVAATLGKARAIVQASEEGE